jgi:hypothetical protein
MEISHSKTTFAPTPTTSKKIEKSLNPSFIIKHGALNLIFMALPINLKSFFNSSFYSSVKLLNLGMEENL